MKKFGLVIFGIFLMVFIIVFLGSTPNEPYHLENLIQHDNYLLGLIEFDDQGELHNRNNFRELLEDLKDEVKKNNLIIVAFVHGWHHSAKERDSNLENFKTKVLTKINELELKNSQAENRTKRKIVGIYLGWRGDSISIDYLNILTFWDRKNTAENIGHRGGVTEVLLELEKIRNTANHNKDSNRLITIGHSFGGLIVYSALSNILMERFISTPPNQIIDGIGDMVVLINPAFSAIKFSNFNHVIQSKKEEEYCQWQPPLMAIFTSKNDLATKCAFPFGRFFSTMFDKHKVIQQVDWKGEPLEIDQQKSNRTAIGHFEPFKNYDFEENLQSTEENHTENKNPWFTSDMEKLLNFSGTRLKRLATNYYLNPYLVIQVDENIIEDHNKIWDEESKILPFLQHIILLSSKNEFLASSDFDKKSQTCLPKQKETSKASTTIEAKAWELEGFKQLLNQNLEAASKAFKKSYEILPTYHNVDEISRLLTKKENQLKEGELTNWCLLYLDITTKYIWGMPNDFKIQMEEYEGCSDIFNRKTEEWKLEAKNWELEGFEQLLNQNIEAASKAFKKSYDILPRYHNVYEISRLLTKEKNKLKEGELTNWCNIYQDILKKYYWGMPNEIKIKMQQYEGCD